MAYGFGGQDITYSKDLFLSTATYNKNDDHCNIWKAANKHKTGHIRLTPVCSNRCSGHLTIT